MHKIVPRHTRQCVRVVFGTDSYEGSLYKRSPYFVGSKFWDALPLDIIELPDVYSFKDRQQSMRPFVFLVITFRISK